MNDICAFHGGVRGMRLNRMPPFLVLASQSKVHLSDCSGHGDANYVGGTGFF